MTTTTRSMHELAEWKRRALTAEYRVGEAERARDFWRAEARTSDEHAAASREEMRARLDAAEREAASLRIQIDHERAVSTRLARLLGATAMQAESYPALRAISGGAV